MEKNKRIITAFCLAFTLLLIIVYCFFPMHIGLNDNGSLSGVERSVGLLSEENGYFSLHYNYVTPDKSMYRGTLASFASHLVSFVKNYSATFDIRCLSFIYLIILLVVVFYVNKYLRFNKLWENILFSVIFIFVFFDVAYLVYLNTLFPEAAFYVFFLLLLSLYVKLMFSEKPQLPTTVFYYIAAFVLCGLTDNTAVLGILFAILGLLLMRKRKGYCYRFVSIIMAMVIIIVPFFKYNRVTDYKKNLFNSVFYGILYNSENAENSLNKLGLSSELSVLAGKTYYDELPIDVNSWELEKEFYSKISYKNIILYYIKNPTKYFSQFKYVANNAFEIRPRYMGNYTNDSGKAPDELAGGFVLYSSIKRTLFPATLWFVYILPLVIILLSINFRKKQKNKTVYDFATVLSILSIFVFNIPMITCGLFEITKNMALYNVVFDSMLITLIGIFIYTSSAKKQEFKEKYGLTQ